ncbi:hypothetical protein [Leekyejoonella antrihumi]|uniref:Uncharacterized protein n=1 Tax=Leekyejoonella antrihumi TaxID=1660198 RepID=A0A563E5V7_9MICO|nr:hypothetical protein [Leekyejoonella antrihumi]TWP37234.1 hypothetical protein FGL98_07450 [Leekyejoonella antrihumi]
MATPEEAQTALLDALVVCTNAIQSKPKDLNATTAERYSQAALHLSEAIAWLREPGQPHGGSVSQAS